MRGVLHFLTKFPIASPISFTLIVRGTAILIVVKRAKGEKRAPGMRNDAAQESGPRIGRNRREGLQDWWLTRSRRCLLCSRLAKFHDSSWETSRDWEALEDLERLRQVSSYQAVCPIYKARLLANQIWIVTRGRISIWYISSFWPGIGSSFDWLMHRAANVSQESIGNNKADQCPSDAPLPQ